MAYVVEEDLAIAAVPNAEGFHELGIAANRSLSDTRELFMMLLIVPSLNEEAEARRGA